MPVSKAIKKIKDTLYYLQNIEASHKKIARALEDLNEVSRSSNEYLRKLSVCAEMYALPRTNQSLFRTVSQRAQEQTLEILKVEMSTAVFYMDHDKFRLHALSKAGPGVALEFGVLNGYTVSVMAEADPTRKFIGFDSFNGLPDEWSGYLKFDFDRNGVPPEVPENVELVVGTFDETLPKFSERNLQIAFIHVDCDIYASTKSIFDNIGKRIKPGCVLVFDEYFNYPGFEMHERKAFGEFLAKTGYGIEWFAYSGQQCAGILVESDKETSSLNQSRTETVVG
jgi:predicted O-methyltransferase YrrM